MEKVLEQIATARVNLSVQHFKYRAVLLNETLVTSKEATGKLDKLALEELAGIIEIRPG